MEEESEEEKNNRRDKQKPANVDLTPDKVETPQPWLLKSDE